MKISYNWLKQFINVDLAPEKISEILTSIGLEVESFEEFQSVKGGLKGVVVGKVLSCEKHPNADKLSKTTVDLGDGSATPIVCGAPNVAAGQTVLVATVGTVLYNGNESFEIKKAKIRGEESCGMICAEDELGVGTSHDGIMVLSNDLKAGMPASDYFGIENDVVFEIGLTPNRADAASHFGVARDIAAFLNLSGNVPCNLPSVDAFSIDSKKQDISVVVEDKERCPRYAGLTISGLTVKESPSWLKNRLMAIGLKPINNVVDITNYILHELGQPLHAFDLAEVAGNKVVVKTLPEKTKIITLDTKERELSAEDLIICNAQEGMCIGGVFGGVKSGVKDSTTAIFLESAYFNPVSIRKTSKRHDLHTDASFRFERGIDPNITIYALKRAAMLIKEIAGGEISSDIFDSNPQGVAPFEFAVNLSKIDILIGKKIERPIIFSIFKSLDIIVKEQDEDELIVSVPAYRVDVQRTEDIVEEILRIYGYNNIEIPEKVNASLIVNKGIDEHRLYSGLSSQLVGAGFVEIMNNSLTRSSYYEKFAPESVSGLVNIMNHLSLDLNVMRQSLLYGGMEVIQHNSNRKNSDLKLFEFGRCYTVKENKEGLDKYNETQHIGVFVTGNALPKSWNSPETKADYFHLKSYVELIIAKLGFSDAKIAIENYSDNEIVGQSYTINNKMIVRFGLVNKNIAKHFDCTDQVFFADFNWTNMLSLYKNKTRYQQLPKTIGVKRDLSMLVSETTTFAEIEKIARDTERKLLRQVGIFDVYRGKGIPEGKKSYAISFMIQDDEKTLQDKDIDKVMNRIISELKNKVGAELR